MKKEILLIIFIAAFGVFAGGISQAKLSTPINALVDTGCKTDDGKCIGEGFADVRWDWAEGGGAIKQFKILFKEQHESVWRAKYPDKDPKKYRIGGLNGPNYVYYWRIKAEAQNPNDDSEFSDGEIIITREALKDKDGGGPGGGTPGGGFLPTGITKPLKAETLDEALNAVLDFLFILAMTIGPLMIIIAGAMMITSAGDPAKTLKARQMILWTAIGIAVILLAKGLPSLVKSVLGG